MSKKRIRLSVLSGLSSDNRGALPPQVSIRPVFATFQLKSLLLRNWHFLALIFALFST